MKIGKLIVNTLAVIGAIVVVDKAVSAISDKATKIISEEMLNNDSESSADEENETFPDIKKYEESPEEEKQSFEYAVKSENITSEPSEV